MYTVLKSHSALEGHRKAAVAPRECEFDTPAVKGPSPSFSPHRCTCE